MVAKDSIRGALLNAVAGCDWLGSEALMPANVTCMPVSDGGVAEPADFCAAASKKPPDIGACRVATTGIGTIGASCVCGGKDPSIGTGDGEGGDEVSSIRKKGAAGGATRASEQITNPKVS